MALSRRCAPERLHSFFVCAWAFAIDRGDRLITSQSYDEGRDKGIGKLTLVLTLTRALSG